MKMTEKTENQPARSTLTYVRSGLLWVFMVLLTFLLILYPVVLYLTGDEMVLATAQYGLACFCFGLLLPGRSK